ncbi:MAG: hypothetical protein QOF81_940, partial [Acidimicrobiaceae bacterium]|nr:hypothetical protein [Acidimicrobiaceae bacterium]
RLLPEALAEGRVVGHAEVVDTGDRKPVNDAQGLIELLCALGPGAGPGPGPGCGSGSGSGSGDSPGPGPGLGLGSTSGDNRSRSKETT